MIMATKAFPSFWFCVMKNVSEMLLLEKFGTLRKEVTQKLEDPNLFL